MKDPTWTTLVLDALRGCDDFLSYAMLMTVTGGKQAQISAACFHLRKRHAIDCVIEVNGVAWWYALPPEADNRSRVVDERTPEVKPRHRRAKAERMAREAREVALRG